MKAFCAAIILFLLLAISVRGQGYGHYSAVDAHALKTDGKDLEVLTLKLIKPYKTDSQKVRVLFRWITHHIAYDVAALHKIIPDLVVTPKSKRYCTLIDLEPDIDPAMGDSLYNTAVANRVLRNRKGVCDGYSRLFKAMCSIAGIECTIIGGSTRDDGYRVSGRIFQETHAWNAVKLNNEWKLIDVTWASGYCDRDSTIFTRSYDEGYYFAQPQSFAYSHYPADSKWLLLDKPETRAKFLKYPYRYRSLHNAAINSFSPETAVIHRDKDSTIRFNLSATDSIRGVMIFGDEESKILYVWIDTMQFSGMENTADTAAIIYEEREIITKSGKRKKVKIQVVSEATQERIESVLEYVNAKDSLAVHKNSIRYAKSMPPVVPPPLPYDLKGRQVLIHYKVQPRLYSRFCVMFSGMGPVLMYDLEY